MEKIEQLKAIEIDKISNDEDVAKHVKNVLDLQDESMIIEYLTFALDTFYKNIEEGQNEKSVELFFGVKEFKPYYELMKTSENVDENVAENTEVDIEEN